MYEQQNRFGVRRLQNVVGFGRAPAYGQPAARPSGDATPPVLEYIRVLLGSPATMPPGFDEVAAAALAAPGVDDATILVKFKAMFCVAPPFLTSTERTQWMQLHPWCPAADVPLVSCTTAPLFASEFDRSAWMARYPDCPPPPAWCPPPPAFANADARARWMAEHTTCAAPPLAPTPVTLVVDNHVCPIDNPHCHDGLTAEQKAGIAPVVAPVREGMNFWKALALLGLGGLAFKALTSAGTNAALVEQSTGGRPIKHALLGAGPARNNPTPVVPEAALRFIVGNLHVGTSDHNVSEEIHKRAIKAGVSPAEGARWVKYALKVHHDNLALYHAVMSGHLSGSRKKR